MANGQLQGVLRHIRKLVAAENGGAQADGELLDRFVRQRDEAAFAALVHRHGAMVLAVCRRVLHHAHDAEDACQAAFLVLARKAGSIRKKDSLASWLHGVAYRAASNLKRGIIRREAREATAVEVSRTDATDVSWREVKALLDEELRRLPESYQAPLILCYLEGKTRDEAARALGWSAGTVKARLERGRDMLRGRLTRRGLTLSAVLLPGLLAEQAGAATLPALQAVTMVKAGLLIASGEAPAVGLVSARTIALMEGVLHAMFATKLKIVTAVFLTASLIGFGFILQAGGTLSADQPNGDEGLPAAAPGLREAGGAGAGPAPAKNQIDPAVLARYKVQSQNNLKELALAMHNYAAVHTPVNGPPVLGHFPPPAIYGGQMMEAGIGMPGMMPPGGRPGGRGMPDMPGGGGVAPGAKPPAGGAGGSAPQGAQPPGVGGLPGGGLVPPGGSDAPGSGDAPKGGAPPGAGGGPAGGGPGGPGAPSGPPGGGAGAGGLPGLPGVPGGPGLGGPGGIQPGGPGGGRPGLSGPGGIKPPGGPRGPGARGPGRPGGPMAGPGGQSMSPPGMSGARSGGQALLSWRVAILPYLGENELYKQFRLNEPWDSTHNLKLLKKMPKVFSPPGIKTKTPYTTFYQVFVGPHAAFEKHRGIRFADIHDGTSNTILIIEAGCAVPWTKPTDLHYAADEPLPELGSIFTDVIHAAFADGAVHTLRKDCDQDMLRRAIVRDDGHVLDWAKLQRPVIRSASGLQSEKQQLTQELLAERERLEALRREMAELKARAAIVGTEAMRRENERLQQQLLETRRAAEEMRAEINRLRKFLDRK